MNDTILNRLLSHIQSKGIIISDVKRLTKAVINGNYNRVMKPYLKLLENQNFGNLEITTDDLLNLYDLDKKISILFLDHLLEIEKRLNTQIAYTIEDGIVYGTKEHLSNISDLQYNSNKKASVAFGKNKGTFTTEGSLYSRVTIPYGHYPLASGTMSKLGKKSQLKNCNFLCP